jgi:hypothetical protein
VRALHSLTIVSPQRADRGPSVFASKPLMAGGPATLNDEKRRKQGGYWNCRGEKSRCA